MGIMTRVSIKISGKSFIPTFGSLCSHYLPIVGIKMISFVRIVSAYSCQNPHLVFLLFEALVDPFSP